MLLWFVGGSLLAVWLVFRDPAIDHRLIVAGALLPDVIDAPTGGAWVGHTVLASVVLLSVVMLATRGRRLLRRQLLALPIGTFLHLVLDGAWMATEVFWWPLLGVDLADTAIPSVERGLLNIPLELVGLAVVVWAWRRFRLAEPERRAHFLRTGRFGRDLVS
ncbi:MAG TPA: hypothetical protein VMN58_05730 [Acidimicrobiales bacterium]|nr:hypothetical protein [Acidimicrobiales bacterium]